MKYFIIIIALILSFIVVDCATTHSRTFYIPSLNLHVKVTINYMTDFSCVYLSHNQEFGANYIKFKSYDKNFPDLSLQYISNDSVFVTDDPLICDIKSSKSILYTKVNSFSKEQGKPEIVIYGRGMFIYAYYPTTIGEKVIEIPIEGNGDSFF